MWWIGKLKRWGGTWYGGRVVGQRVRWCGVTSGEARRSRSKTVKWWGDGTVEYDKLRIVVTYGLDSGAVGGEVGMQDVRVARVRLRSSNKMRAAARAR